MSKFVDKILKEAYWGSIGGGVLPICIKTKRILVGLRSSDIMEPHTWGIFGGKLDIDEGVNETIEQAVKRELKEETGYAGSISLKPAYIFKNKGFEYHNFIGIVNDEFHPSLDWENDDAKWMTYEELINLKSKHFGLSALLKNSNDIIQRVISEALNVTESILYEKSTIKPTPKNVFPKEFLEALGSWVMRYSISAANVITNFSSQLPSIFKTAPSVLYRVVVWKKGMKGFQGGIRSWSTSLEIAQDIGSNGLVEAGPGETEVIFKIKTDPSRVILNMVTFGKSAMFKKSANYWENNSDEKLRVDQTFFDEYALMNEKEVIYNQPVITEKDIFMAKLDERWIKVNPKFGVKNFFK